jgi:hypothetical protein
MGATNLFGQFHVTPTTTGMKEAADLFPKYGDYQELRKHALKLAFWPNASRGSSGLVCDLNWEEIDGMKAPRACELRIDDVIGGMNNLRLIFYVFSKTLVLPGDVLPRLWTIGVMQKKTQRFSANDLRTFAARVTIIRKRTYSDYL